MRRICFVDITPIFKAGDPEPEGYLEWHEWARVQMKAGLKQVRRKCGYFHFPQEKCKHIAKDISDAGFLV